jgi:hypothetical protein
LRRGGAGDRHERDAGNRPEESGHDDL